MLNFPISIPVVRFLTIVSASPLLSGFFKNVESGTAGKNCEYITLLAFASEYCSGATISSAPSLIFSSAAVSSSSVGRSSYLMVILLPLFSKIMLFFSIVNPRNLPFV